jgi:hypothetical protein
MIAPSGTEPPRRSRRARRRRSALLLGAALLLLGAGGVACWVWWGRESPGQIERRLRAEVPVGSGQDALWAWLDRNGLTTRNWDTTERPPGVAVPAGGSVVWVALPGQAGRDDNYRPLRSDVYVVLDRDGRVAGYLTRTYPRKGEWERLLP